MVALTPYQWMLPQMVMKKTDATQTPEVKSIMAAIHSHDSEYPMGWIGKGINSLSKALTGVLSKEARPVK